MSWFLIWEISKVHPISTQNILSTQWKMCVWYKAEILRVLIFECSWAFLDTSSDWSESFSLHWSFDLVYKNPVQTYQIPEALVDISEEDATSCMLMIFTFLWQLMSMSSAHGSLMILNTPRPKHNDRQLADYISNLIFLSDNCFILFHFSLSFVTNMPALVQIMGWYKTEFQREFSIFEIQDMIKI